MRNFYFWMLTLFCSSLMFGQLSENFESDITDRGWSLYQTGSDDPGFVITSSQSYNGNYSYFHDDDFMDVMSTSYMVSPAYTVQAGDNLSVFVRQEFSNLYYVYSGIAISTASSDPIANPTDFIEIWEAGANFAEDTWEEVTVELEDYVGQTVHIAFIYQGEYDHRFYVDQFYMGAICDAAVATTNVISACETNEFNVELDITDLGSASSLLITDNLGNSQNASATGSLTFGPYASGTTLTFTIADEDNATCNVILTTTYLCAPENDDCDTATPITSFPYNGSEDATGATQTSFVSCGVDASNDGVWYTFEGESAQYTINVTSNNWDSAVSVFAGSCGEFSCVGFSDNAASNAQETVTFIGQAGVTYYINVGAYSSNVDLEEGTFDLEVLSEEIPCGAPTNLGTQTTTDLSTEVNWQGAGDNESYDLVWGETGFTPGAEANATNLNTPSYTIAQLTPETTYDVYVRGNCNPGYSVWVGPVTFTTLEEGAVVAGTDCIHPINIVTLPFSTTDNTNNYGDDYDGSPGSGCGTTSSYLSGDDVVYAYTPTEDTSINISMTPTASWSGLFVYENCSDIGVSCFAAVANSSTTERQINELIVTGGQTYYIVISTWTSPQSTAYTLNITENTCISGSFEFNTIGACETDEYNVEVVVNSMGSLDSYEVTDNHGGATQTITATGTYTFGPYEQSNAVTFDFAANDENCSFSETVNYFCPAPNDDCENSITVPVNDDFSCDVFISGSTLGATASPQVDDVVGTPNNDVWFDFVATATSHRISLLNIVNLGGGGTGVDMAFGVYDASSGCEALVLVNDSDPNTLNLSDLNVGTTYLIRVYNYSTVIGNHSFDVCIGTPPSTTYDIECGTPLEMTYCYENNENFSWIFNSNSGEPVTIQFTAGTVEDNFDIIRIYDGGVLLWNSFNANPNGTRFNLEETVFTAMSGTLSLEFTSDGSASCSASADINTWEFSVTCGSDIPMVDWANLEGPESGTVAAGNEFIVYGQVFKAGVTEAEGPADEISAWVGYSTTDTNPDTWDNWIPATFSSQEGDNDEYMADIGSSLPSVGTYYYAMRYRLDWGPFTYGGYNSGEWDGTTNVSGVLTLTGPENDDCSGAIALECGVPITGDTAAATASGLPTTCGSWSSSDGRDLFYTFEADGTSDYLISVTPLIAAFDAVLFVYSGTCDDLVYVGCDDSGNPEQVELLAPAAGTYYVRVFDFTGTGTFELEMECFTNTCLPATYDISPSGECIDDEFFLYVDFTSMGTITEYVLTDNQGNPSQTVTEIGEYTFGPYASNTSVTIEFVADEDTSCNITETITYNCPGPGEACENPLIVDSLPYFTSDDTANYGSNYGPGQGSGCGSTSQYYLNGNEVVYAYTPEYDTSINIYLDPLGQSWTGLFVYNSCANIGVECLAGVASTNSTVREIEDFQVFAGETYYIVLSIWSAPQSYDYTLEITENSCSSGAFELNPIAACETNEYNVEIDVTSMGTLDSYEVTDNQGGATQTITAIGTYTFGPYASGSEVTFDFVANDANCNDTASVVFHCPAPNDECEDAILVPVNEDFSCDLFISGTTLGATASPQIDDVVGTPNNDVWFEFVATSTNHRISLLNVVNLGGGGTGTDMAFGVYDASSGCEALVLVNDSDPNTLNLSGLTVGTNYLIRVYNWSTTIGNHSFDVCIGTPPPPLPTEYDIECGTPLEISYCYGSSENWGWTFTSTTGDPLTITFTAGSIEDNWDFIRLYDGSDATGTLLWDSNNANPNGFRFELAGTTFTAESGVLYFAFTSDSSASCEQTSDIHTWEFTVECEGEAPVAPANDECDEATDLFVGEAFGDYAMEGTTQGATTNAIADPSCGVFEGGDVWYTVTVPENGTLYVETQSAGELSSTGMAAYTGTCGELVEFMCAADEGGFAMISGSELTPGEVFYIRVWSNDANAGSFNISAWTDPMSVVDYAGAAAVKIYPNPTSDMLNIAGIEVKDVQVYSASGQLAKVRVSNNVVDTRGLQSGTYIIRMTDNEGNVVLRKFIKK